jgi:hypothetical protein
MVLLGDKAQVEVHLGLFGHSANLDTRWVHGLRQTYNRVKNHFGRTRWNSKVTSVMSNIVLVCLETMLVLVQGRCTVCAKRAQQSFWTTQMVLLGDEAQV